MSWVADLSYAWSTLTGAVLRSLGAGGVIGYAGCDDFRKNVSHDRVQDWITAGLWTGLVIENGPRDLASGAAVGAAHASKLIAAARMVDYDYQHCVLFTGADFDETAADYAGTLAGWNAFADTVPVPGYYGDSDSIDYLAAHAGRPPVVCWQSESGSFSPEHPSPHAQVWQRFNDSRAQGHALDVNDILSLPLYMMGENMETDLTPAAVSAVTASVKTMLLAGGVLQDLNTQTRQLEAWLTSNIVARLQALTPASFAAELVKVLPSGVTLTEQQLLAVSEEALRIVLGSLAPPAATS